MQELRALLDEYPGDRVLVGEDENVAFHGTDDDELHLVFNFPLMRAKRLTPAHIRANQAIRLAELPPGAWPCNTLGNHDSPRVWSRYGDGVHDAALARLHLALMLTLKGTPFLYNGEEIGMTDLALTSLSQMRDTAAISQYQLMTEKQGIRPKQALQAVIATTRDRCRSPMQWRRRAKQRLQPARCGNLAAGQPKLCQRSQRGGPAWRTGSLLTFYRAMLHLRRANPALIAGDYHGAAPAERGLFCLSAPRRRLRQTCPGSEPETSPTSRRPSPLTWPAKRCAYSFPAKSTTYHWAPSSPWCPSRGFIAAVG